MSTKRLSILILAVAIVCGEACAQTSPPPAGGSKPSELTIRDNQGKLVTVPPGNPAKPVNYVKWLNDTLSKGITDNAANVYDEAYKLHDYGDVKDDELDKALAGPWQDLPSVSAWLTAIKPCLAKFREAVSKRQCYFQVSPCDLSNGPESWIAVKDDPRCKEWLVGGLYPGLATHRGICKALVAEGWQDWKQGKQDRLIDNAVTILRSVRHLDDQLSLMEHLVGTSCTNLAYDSLRKAVSVSRDPDALAARLAGKLNNTVDPPLDTGRVRCLNFELLTLLDTCQRLFAPGEKPGSWRVSKGMLAVLAPFNMENLTAGKVPEDADKQLAQIGYDATVREFGELFKRAQAFMAKPYSGAVKEGEGLTASIEKSKNPLVKMVMFDVVFFRQLDERRVAHRRATHLIVQLYVYHAKNRAFPERLDELTAADLKEIRTDPFSGKDFCYKKQGSGFLLYSVGVNLKDDGGKHDASWKEGDFVFWPVQKDYVLTLPRAKD